VHLDPGQELSLSSLARVLFGMKKLANAGKVSWREQETARPARRADFALPRQQASTARSERGFTKPLLMGSKQD